MAEVSSSPFARRTTGVPTPDDIVLGRGKLYGAELTAAFAPDGDGWFDMGECSEFSLEPSTEFLEHYSSREGLRTLDKKIPIQQKFDLRVVLQELNEKNAALWLSATPAAYTNAAIAGFTEHQMIAAVELGRWYDIVNSSGQRAVGIDNTDLVVEKSGSPDTTLTEGTDYTVDEAGGRIFFLSTASGIVDGDPIDVTLTANASADTTRRIPVQSRDSVTLALKFYGEDPDSGRKYELFIPKCTLAANGSLGLITEQEWIQMAFTGAAEKKDADTAVAYFMALPTGGVT